MATGPLQVLTAIGTNVSNTVAFITTAAIPVGALIVVALNRSAVGGLPNGLQGTPLSTSAGGIGTLTVEVGACRANTHDLTVVTAKVTTAIPVGATITAWFVSSGNRRAGVLAVFTSLGARTTYSSPGGGSNADGATSVGANGSGVTGTVSTAQSTTGPVLILGVHATGGTTATTPDPAFVLAGESKTAVGSTDRGVLLQYRYTSVEAVQVSTCTYAVSSGWAACSVGYVDIPPPATGPQFVEYDGTTQRPLEIIEFDGATVRVLEAVES